MKDIDITDYDPDEIHGHKIDNSWFEAINIVTKTFVDPSVVEIYKICLDFNDYHSEHNILKWRQVKKYKLNKKVSALIAKYNPERDDDG